MTTGDTFEGVVLSGTGGIWNVRTTAGDVHPARLRGRLKQVGASEKLAVGDSVALEPDDTGDTWSITKVNPRRSRLARREPGGGPGERVVVANIDQVVVVFSAAKPEPHPGMLDRFLVIAEANDLSARIVVNKVDLIDSAIVIERFSEFVRAGYPVQTTSTKSGAGLPELRAILAGRISALTGPSGVGKSSLLNSLYPGLALRVGEISPSVNKGRHTTVGALLHPLPDGGFVADTPGLREVGVWGIDPKQLDQCFPELRDLVRECRFANCVHDTEPGCAVRGAVESGAVSARRYESYRKLREELEEAASGW